MQKKIKQNNGFTLIEALIAIILLSIFSLMLVQGIRMSVNAFNINKIKTQAVTIANEEIEKIKSMPFNDIGLLDGNPQGSLQRQKYTEDGFLIEYEVTFVNEDSRLKQIIVSVLKEPMVKKLEVVTEIGLFSIGEGGSETTTTVS
ncbi:MAG: type II secretion system protein, partial [Actinomycetota bacterium]|nr:type II secretion system protein [Actinomycetota bacterium]